MRAVGVGEALGLVADRIVHAGRAEHAVADEALPALPADRRDQFAGNHVEDVVVSVAAAEAGCRLDVAQRAHHVQIGSEWWRERVCQYVSISAVAVSLKKQKTHVTPTHATSDRT